MESPLISSAFSSSRKAYIHQTQMKIKGLVYRDVEVQLGFEKALGLIQTRLDLLLDFSKDVEEENEAVGSAQAEEEEIRDRKRYLDDEFGIAVSMCHVVDHFTVRRKILFGRVFDDVDDYTEKGAEIAWFKTQMDEFTERASSFGIGKGKGRESDKEQLTVIGLEVDVQVLSQQLVQEMCQLIWIVGAQGIGKTTLAMQVFDNSIICHHFELRIWVTISPQYNLRNILKNLMKEIPVRYLTRPTKYSTATIPELVEQILHVLRSVRCLIVLDGLQTYEALKSLDMYGSRTSFENSRIMITTRSRELANHVKSTYHMIHEMRTLGDQDAWVLFNSKVHVPSKFEKLGIELVRKCMGYPMRILALANTFLETAVTEDEMLKLINQDLDANQVSVFNKLEVAVNSLPSHLKDCLSFFELFNDDFEIPMRRLIAYWVAEGHVQQEEGGSKEPPEALAEKQLMDFIRQNMIQVAKWKINGRVKTCRLSYFLRDNWLSKVKKERADYNKEKKDAAFKLSNFLDVNHKKAASTSSSGTGMIIRFADHLNNKEKSFSHIHGNQKISHSSFKENYGDLCSLVSFDTREGPVPGEAIGTFLSRGIAARCFRMMRVLDLEGVFRPNLPETIQKLLQLRYLGLRSTYIERLPSTIGKLFSLHTSDLKHTCIRSVPRSVWNIQQLRHIYLSESYRSRVVAPPKNSSLVDFQTLWGAYVDEETLIVNGLDRLINLRKLSLVCRLTTTQQKELARWISGLEHLESLRLRSVNELVRASDIYLKSLSGLHKLSSIYILGRLMDPVVMHGFSVSVTEITLSFSKLVDDPMMKLQKLPNLRILNLYAASYTGKTMVVSSGGFPLLRVLNLWKLEELEKWTVKKGGLMVLRDLEIRSCNKLKNIPDGVERLGLCQELKLTNMPEEFQARVTENSGQDWHKIAHIPSVIIKN